jgi:hypothetical protein
MLLSPYFAVTTGARQIARGAADLSQVAQATLNNTDCTADRDSLEEIKRHLDAAVEAAMALEREVVARDPQ